MEPPSKPARFQFSLRAVLLTFVVVAASYGLAGSFGFFLAFLVILISTSMRSQGGISLVELVVVIALFWIGQAVFMPSYHGSTPQERAGWCHSDLTKIAIAVSSYHDTYGRFPPASVPDTKGRPAHSWRVLILPFLGYEDLYQKYDFDEPWDGPNNSLLAPKIPFEYECRSFSRVDRAFTNRAALVGSDTVFRANMSLQQSEITDSATNTIMLVETDRTDGIHWMEPVDFPVKDAILPSPEDPPVNSTAPNSLALGPIHLGCFHVAMADGTVESLRTDIPQSALDALATANGGESVALKPLTKTEPSAWAKPVALAIFIYSSIAMFYGARRGFLKHKKQAEVDADIEEQTIPNEATD